MRATILGWLDTAIAAVDPQRLTAAALRASAPRARNVIAIGKAAPAMCRGAAEVLGRIEGVCVAAARDEVPDGIELLVGDHPVPRQASLDAGRRILEFARRATEGSIVLVSGGGSALCEWPRPGIDPAYLQRVNSRLLLAGSSITETNLVRGHLSAIKCGGLTRATPGPVATYILSDVGGAGPEVVASGPTLPMGHDPQGARQVMESAGMDVPEAVWEAMAAAPELSIETQPATVIGSGLTAARAIVDKASSTGLEAVVASDWLHGDVEGALDRIFGEAPSGVTVAAGEIVLRVEREGRGGRNTHAALLAARRLEGSDALFAAFATDGVDGSARAAGAIVDGATLLRGGDPSPSLAGFDSAAYLETTGDLVVTGPTGTNVADLWLLWRP